MKVLLLKEPSFGGSHACISSTCLKVRNTLFMYSVINSIIRKHCSIALFLNVHLKISFINWWGWKRFVQYNKRKHSIVLAGSRRVRTTCTINSATNQFITSILKSLATLVIWLAPNGGIYSQISPFLFTLRCAINRSLVCDYIFTWPTRKPINYLFKKTKLVGGKSKKQLMQLSTNSLTTG